MRKFVNILVCLILLLQPVVLLAANGDGGCPMASAGLQDGEHEPCCCCEDDCGESFCESGCLLGILYQSVVSPSVGNHATPDGAASFVEPRGTVPDGFDPPHLRPPIDA